MDLSQTALIAVDIQNDFCPGGALAVTDGDAVVGPTNALMARCKVTLLTQDWHPAGHSSFASSHAGKQPYDTTQMPYGTQVLWPDHCIQGTPGAAFHADLDTDRAALVVRKGYNPAIDSYSAFFENDQTTPTGLAGALRTLNVDNLLFTGLALDFCVGFSALDARKLGFSASIVRDATRAIDLNGSLDDMLRRCSKAGVALIETSDVV